MSFRWEFSVMLVVTIGVESKLIYFPLNQPVKSVLGRFHLGTTSDGFDTTGTWN